MGNNYFIKFNNVKELEEVNKILSIDPNVLRLLRNNINAKGNEVCLGMVLISGKIYITGFDSERYYRENGREKINISQIKKLIEGKSLKELPKDYAQIDWRK